MRKKTMRCEWVKCGKSGCKSCPHGPYWYAYWKVNGKLHKEYVGKGAPKDEKAAPDTANGGHRHDAIFCDRTASAWLSFEIIGVPNPSDYQTTKAAYRQRAAREHPDRGGDETVYKRLGCAWAYLRKVYNWS